MRHINVSKLGSLVMFLISSAYLILSWPFRQVGKWLKTKD